MSETHDSVVRMANQIARNFAVLGEDEAAAATAEHIRQFWDPRMKDAFLSCEESELDPIVRKARGSLFANEL